MKDTVQSPMQSQTQKETLLALLRGHAPEPALSGDAWAALIRLARQNFVLAAVKDKTVELGIELPLIAGRRLLRAERDDTVASFRNVAALRELLHAMAEAGVRVAPLKGPALLERLYGNALRRPCADLDVLVPLEEITRADAVLKRLGYEEEGLGAPRKWSWERGAVKVEVHGEFEERAVLEQPMETVWARARSGEFQGQPMWVLHPADELVFLSAHAVRHGLHRLSWMAEMARAFEVLGAEVGAEFPQWYAARAVAGVVLLAQTVAERLMGKAGAPMKLVVTAKVRRRIAAMADRMWEDMLLQRPEPRTRLGMNRFWVELEPSAIGRAKAVAKQMGMSCMRVSVEDIARAKAMGVRSRWGTWCVRQMGLMEKLARR